MVPSESVSFKSATSCNIECRFLSFWIAAGGSKQWHLGIFAHSPAIPTVSQTRSSRKIDNKPPDIGKRTKGLGLVFGTRIMTYTGWDRHPHLINHFPKRQDFEMT